MTIQLSPEEISTVKVIINSTPFEVIIFGSRVNGTARKDSDLDICLRRGNQSIPLIEIARLRERFELSNLPFVVDLVDYQNLSDPFKKAVDEQGRNIRDI
ncbi:nucleotidyltransferase domain-containing protein [bacterium]|nr:nucleotidyltransferase domain-containing protein [bacterium]